MTSPLLKKLRITLRSKRGSIIKHTLGALALSVLLPAGWLAADEPGYAHRSQLPSRGHVRLVGLEEAKDAPALQRLKDRDPESRWDGLKRNPGATSQAQPLPVEVQQKSIPLRAEDRLPRTSTVREQLPMLPDANEFDQFEASPIQQQPVFAVQPPQEQTIRPYEETLAPPDTVRPLSTIQPYYDFKGSSKSPFDSDDVAPGVDVHRVPEDKLIPTEPYQPRLSPDVVFEWEPSNLWHNPLWFEDPALERYGHAAHPLLQPFISTGRMTTQLVGLPYQSTIDPYHTRRYTLGWYRPGECAPELIYQIPFNWDAAAVQAGAVTAGVFIFP